MRPRMADENGLYSICVKKEGGGKELAEAHWPGKFAVRLVCRDEVVCSLPGWLVLG
jgi:hypothetical protein